MSKKQAVEGKILDVAYRLFLKSGYRNTTMDDIAQDLKISKKTLYAYYSGKLELLEATFELMKTRLSSKVEAVLENRHLSFPLKLKSTLSVIATHLAPIKPELLEELREHAPEIWKNLMSYINESAYLRFAKLIEQGMAQGLVNPRINSNLIVLLYAAAVQSLLDPKFCGQFPESIQKGMKMAPGDIYDQAISIIYSGILTEEARNEFQNA